MRGIQRHDSGGQRTKSSLLATTVGNRRSEANEILADRGLWRESLADEKLGVTGRVRDDQELSCLLVRLAKDFLKGKVVGRFFK